MCVHVNMSVCAHTYVCLRVHHQAHLNSQAAMQGVLDACANNVDLSVANINRILRLEANQ